MVNIGSTNTAVFYLLPFSQFYGLGPIEVPGVKVGWHHTGPVVPAPSQKSDEGEVVPHILQVR